MGKTLEEIAQEIKQSNKKIQLIYAFNGTGKTRLSQEFEKLINQSLEDINNPKILYYNSFTEDLFYWKKNYDLKLCIQNNPFTKWILQEQGQDQNVIKNFQFYTDKNLMPLFSKDFSEVSFSYQKGNDEDSGNIKISKGEESNFIWSLFYTLLEQIIETLKVTDINERETDQFNQLEYIFIDDPVSSLDENHLIGIAVDLAELITSIRDLKFIISTHSTVFYNVLYNEINKKTGYLLTQHEDRTFSLENKSGDSNTSFSYHLFLKELLEKAIENNDIKKFHFILLRNLYEKVSSFLGYKKWHEILPNNQQAYYARIMNFASHSSLSADSIAEPNEQEKKMVEYLLKYLINTYKFNTNSE